MTLPKVDNASHLRVRDWYFVLFALNGNAWWGTCRAHLDKKSQRPILCVNGKPEEGAFFFDNPAVVTVWEIPNANQKAYGRVENADTD